MGTSPVDYQPGVGEVSGLALYARELTAQDVLRHYENWTQTHMSPDLEGALDYYPFSEGAGRDIHNAVASEPDLRIPERYAVPDKALLRVASQEFEANWDYLNDVVRNIIGFVPLGAVLCAYWRRSRHSRGRRFSMPLLREDFSVLRLSCFSFLSETELWNHGHHHQHDRDRVRCAPAALGSSRDHSPKNEVDDRRRSRSFA